MREAISVTGLVKTFGTTRALNGLDLHVETGEIHGFLGPNGAGKTTTLRVLLGLLRADAGEARLLGGDPWADVVTLHRIREGRSEGRTVLLSSHILSEVEVLADRVSIIREGRTVESGYLAELRHLTRTSIVAETVAPADSLAALPGVHHLHAADGQVSFEVDGERLEATVRALADLGVRSLVAHPPALEQLLLRYYADEPSPRGGETAEAAR